ncbi:MAG: nucleotidyltransferase domain-containing protein [Kouleothrix sp.]|nr:nucleotidyltransferase domain-containing protein [Kouleothrix sp.]
MTLTQDTEQILQQIVATVAGLSGVVAISLGGSHSAGLADSSSDLDLHVYCREPLAPPADRATRLAQVADPGSLEVDIRDWGLEDHLRVAGRDAELIYVPLDDLRAEVERAYRAGLAGEAFTTARLYYVASGRAGRPGRGSVRADQGE